MTRALAAAAAAGVPLFVVAAALSIPVAYVAIARPTLALGTVVAIGVLAGLGRVPRRYVVAGLLAYLPFQELVISELSGSAALVARYAPELAVYWVAAGLLVTRFSVIRERLGSLFAPLALVLGFWILTGIWNAVSPTTIAIGLRSEFRFLPLVVIPLVARDLRRDSRLWGQVLVAGATVQATLAIVQFFGGTAVRALFAPQYDIVLGGVTVGQAGPPLFTVFGTFAHRNDLGAFLAFTWTILAAAGGRQLGLSPRLARAIGVLLVVGTVVSGSREGGIALLVAALVLARERFRIPVLRLAALSLIVVVGLGFALLPPVGGSSGVASSVSSSGVIIDDKGEEHTYLHSSSLVDRWRTMFTPEAWTPSYYTNFRLFLLASNAKEAAAEAPIFGFGLGTASDPRKIADRSTPMYRTFAGERAVEFGFNWDGNWALLVLEVGLGGLAVLAVLFWALYRLGTEARPFHWAGRALMAFAVIVPILGFFAASLQHRQPMAILWLTTGIAAAAAFHRRRSA